MDTALKTEEEKKEYFDPEDVLDQKCQLLADMIRTSEHFISFTGAGISTSTGVKDFRSGINTVLKTGPGAWEKQAQNIKDTSKYVSVSTLKAVPSDTHMALLQLERYGLLKYLISQNTDGLHRRSGFPPEKLAELHGNTNMEKCQKCKNSYMRDFHTRNAQKVHEHQTGRKCDNQKCNGDLYDTIINFGENLPEKDMDNGFLHSQIADLCLVMGSSLRVNPAAQMPQIVGEQGKNLVIVNLQKTPLDSLCSLRIFAQCDDVMKRVMKKLEIDIPEFILQRRLKLTRTNNNILNIMGQDIDGSPYQIIKQTIVKYGSKQNKNVIIKNGPYDIQLQQIEVQQQNSQQNQKKQENDSQFEKFEVEFFFFGNYNETVYNLKIDPNDIANQQTKVYLLEFSPKLRQWFNFSEEKLQK